MDTWYSAPVPRHNNSGDHYLKGTPAPVSMTDGVPQLRKGLDPTIIAPTTTKKKTIG